MTAIATILSNVIKSGNFKLEAMTSKVDTLWAEGKLTDADRAELAALVQQYLNPASQAPELLETYARLEAKYADLDARVKALEGKEEVIEDYPEWQQWSGVPGSGYFYGAKVTHNGIKYHSEYKGENVWEPGALGTEALWVVDE